MFGVRVDTPEFSMGWVDPWVGLGRDFPLFGEMGWVECTMANVLKCERMMLVHLKHGQITSGCTKQINS